MQPDYSEHLDFGSPRSGIDNYGKHDKTLIVKRMDLQFNSKPCQVLNFTDITMYKQLKQE